MPPLRLYRTELACRRLLFLFCFSCFCGCEEAGLVVCQAAGPPQLCVALNQWQIALVRLLFAPAGVFTALLSGVSAVCLLTGAVPSHQSARQLRARAEHSFFSTVGSL